MTYRERYELAEGWSERHVAQDLYFARPDEQLSQEDAKKLDECRQRDGFGALGGYE